MPPLAHRCCVAVFSHWPILPTVRVKREQRMSLKNAVAQAKTTRLSPSRPSCLLPYTQKKQCLPKGEVAIRARKGLAVPFAPVRDFTLPKRAARNPPGKGKAQQNGSEGTK